MDIVVITDVVIVVTLFNMPCVRACKQKTQAWNLNSEQSTGLHVGPALPSDILDRVVSLKAVCNRE